MSNRILYAYETDDGATMFVLAAPSLPADLPITPAERDIALQILEGRSNAAIAKARGVSLPTVAKQVSSIFQKLGASSRAELVALLLRDGRGAAPEPRRVP